MDSRILDGLNDQQRAAVTCESNVLQVLAPPGSGKTKTLTARVAYHIEHEGLKPWNIIVCTFTIKAAREMKERIRNFVGDELEKKLVLGTFHSISRRYLSTYGHYIGVPKNFGIADSNDTSNMLKRICKKGEYNMEPNKAKSRISKVKSGVVKPRDANKKPSVESQEFDAIYAAYEQELADAKLLDYDDLLLRCVDLLRKCPECVSNVEAVLIDEFQDTNHVQYELMNLFAQHGRVNDRRKPPKITIVGDPDQSIYSFRSAEIANLKRMQERYADTIVIHLEENYRSAGSILRFATEVIEQDTARPQKNLQATHTVGSSPVLRTVGNASIEASWIVSEIRRSMYLNAGLLKYEDYSILLRSASLSRLIETELGRAGIPYRMVGGLKFFDRFEVRLLLDYLRVISQPDHNDALLRVLNVPSRKIGDATVQALLKERDARGKTLWFVIKSVAQGNIRPNEKIPQVAMAGLETFTNLVLTAQRKLKDSETTVASMLEFVQQKLKFENFLKATYKEDYEERGANVDELVNLARSGKVFAEQDEELIRLDGIEQAQSEAEGPAEVLNLFLSKISLATDADKQEADNKSNDKVVISTIHAAKGLEWPVVFIPAAYQGSIPHSRAEDIDEERRLLYVGMTRAKALLYLSWPKRSSKTEHTIQSPFLTTSTISRYYECRGPEFGWQISHEVATILGRPCPSSSAIDDRYMTLGQDEADGIRARDDRHPEDVDEESAKYLNLYSEKQTGDFLDQNYGDAGFKRAKLKHSSSSELNTDHMSMPPSNAGFVSAKEQMRTVKEDTKRHRSPEKEVPARKVPQQAAKSAPASSSKKLAIGQQTLSRFFVARTQNTTAAPTLIAKSLQPYTSTSRVVHETASTLPKASVRMQNFTSRSISNNTAFNRPRAVFEDDDNAGQQKYVLLSSSPAKADDPDDRPTRPEEEEKENSQAGFEAEPEHKTTMHATSMHTTSMQRIGRLPNRPGAKRNLGGRPTTNDRVNKPFQRPTFRQA